MLVIDEAARVPDDLYRTVRPMLAASNGRLICLSTPYGKRGFFHDAWAHGGADWTRIEVPAQQVSAHRAEFLAEERRCLGEAWFRQEYECSFEALEGLVYPDFARCVAYQPPLRDPQRRGPAGGRHRLRLPQPVRRHLGRARPRRRALADRRALRAAAAVELPRRAPAARGPWYADPAGASEIAELRLPACRDRSGRQPLRPGIAPVTARLETGTLKVVHGACPNLLAEAGLYRWERRERLETPEDEHNHALAALRYLISKLDQRSLGKMVKGVLEKASCRRRRSPRPWVRYDNPALWTPVWFSR